MKIMLKMVAILTLVIMIAGCQDTSFDDSKVNIVTSFYPMYILTSNIVDGANNVELTNLTSNQAGCLHDYQITTNDMVKLSHADVLIANGGGMESFIEKATSLYKDLKVIDASNEFESQIVKTDDDNSHYWVSISLYIEQVKSVSKVLCEIDPSNATLYEKNAKEYISKLETLKNKMHNALDSISSKNIITFHEAFSYFADEFNLDIVAVIEREPGTYPSSKEVADIIELVKSKDVKAIFVEPQYSRTAADTIARETNVNVYTLDPVVTGEFNKDAYITTMEQNLNTLVEALS